MTLYRRSAQLAFQAMLVLATEPAGSWRPVREIAVELGVPATYLTKVLQSLTRVGLLNSLRGPGGGVQLARSAQEIYLWDVLTAIQPAGEFQRCLVGLRTCNDLHPCPLHEAWRPIRTQIRAMLQTKTLWEFATRAREKGLLRGESAQAQGPAPVRLAEGLQDEAQGQKTL